jgi:hypothetical protein
MHIMGQEEESSFELGLFWKGDAWLRWNRAPERLTALT